MLGEVVLGSPGNQRGFLQFCLVVGLLIGLARPAASQSYQFTKVLDSSTVRPDGLGNFFISTITTPAFDGTWVAFRDPGPQNDDGSHAAIWSFNTQTKAFRKLVSFNTTVPGGTTNFHDFQLQSTAPTVRNGTVIFVARDTAAQQGLYSVAAAGGSLARIADSTTADPTGGTFTLFDGGSRQVGAFTFDGTTAAFYGTGTTLVPGTYSAKPDGSSLAMTADSLHPAQNGRIIGFYNPSISGSNVVMIGADAAPNGTGYNGIYLGTAGGNGVVTELVNSGQQLPGNTNAGFHTRFDQPVVAFDGTLVAFRATDSNSAAGFFGLFRTDLTSHTISPIADVHSTLPGLGTLRAIATSSVAVNQGSVLFQAMDTTGASALYVWQNGTIARVVGKGDLLDGRMVQAVGEPGPAAMFGGAFVFLVDFGPNRALYMATPGGLAPAGSIPHLAVGGGWSNVVTLVNTGTTQTQAHLDFYGDNGGALTLPVGSQATTSVDQTIAAGASLILPLQSTQALVEGWSQLLSTGGVGGMATFLDSGSGQQLSTLVETRNAASYIVPFDDSTGSWTGLAVANVSATAASVPVVIRDDAGVSLGSDTIQLAARGHTAFMLTDRYAATAGRRGTVELDTPAGGQIGVFALRAVQMGLGGGLSLSTIPVLANVVPGTGGVAHVASGGGWQVTFTLVNAGTSAAQAQLSFFDEAGSPLALPLSYPQTSRAVTASAITETVAAGSTLIVVAQALNAASPAVGSAQLTSSGSIGGFATFLDTLSGQQTSVPVETRNAAAYIVPFDHTGGVATGVAVASLAPQAGNIPVTIRDETGATIGSSILSLPGLGHTAFVLADSYPITAGKRGTVEFGTPAGGRISALALRFVPAGNGVAGALTTVPVLAR